MNTQNKFGRQFALALAATLLPIIATQAQTTIAHWRFEPGAFLVDSSGNGNSLVNGTDLANPDANDATPSGAVSGVVGSGSGSAFFDGGDILRTLATLDLSAFPTLEISWQQRVQTTTLGVLFEHSPNKNSNPGGFLADVNEIAVGQGWPSLSTPTGNNNDGMPHLTDGMTWESFTLRLDLTATDPADVLTVTNGFPTAPQAADVVPFLNDMFYIGARQGPNFGFIGNIDELQIVGVPEPSAFLFAALGAAMGLGCTRRRLT